MVFEGIQSRPAASGAQITMGVRQNIPVILRPAGLAVDRAPWRRLVWSAKGGMVRVNNPSPYVVRLARSVSLVPGGAMLDLGHLYSARRDTDPEHDFRPGYSRPAGSGNHLRICN